MRLMPRALAVLALTLAIGWACALSQPACAYPYVTWREVGDRPLLESPCQVTRARLYGVCSFYIGSEYFVVRDLPGEYVDYSAKCVRMP